MTLRRAPIAVLLMGIAFALAAFTRGALEDEQVSRPRAAEPETPGVATQAAQARRASNLSEARGVPRLRVSARRRRARSAAVARTRSSPTPRASSPARTRPSAAARPSRPAARVAPTPSAPASAAPPAADSPRPPARPDEPLGDGFHSSG